MNLTTDKGMARARQDQLVIKEMPDEVLVYDLKTHKAHCLNKTAAFVWSQCDGETSAAEIAQLMTEEGPEPVSEEIVWLALKQLSKANLLQMPVNEPATTPRVSRRAMMHKLGWAAAVTLPLVTTVLVPTAATAATIAPPVACQSCRKKSDGVCPASCSSSVLGTCYDNSGCGNGQVINSLGCVSCSDCFGAFPAGATISWKAPGDLNC